MRSSKIASNQTHRDFCTWLALMKGLNFPASTTLVSPTSAMFPISLGNLAVDSFRESSQRCGLKVTTMPTTPDKCTAPFLASEEAWMWQLGTTFEQTDPVNTWRWIEWYWMDPGCKAVLDYFPLAHASWWWRGDSANLASLMSCCTSFKQENGKRVHCGPGRFFTLIWATNMRFQGYKVGFCHVSVANHGFGTLELFAFAECFICMTLEWAKLLLNTCLFRSSKTSRRQGVRQVAESHVRFVSQHVNIISIHFLQDLLYVGQCAAKHVSWIFTAMCFGDHVTLFPITSFSQEILLAGGSGSAEMMATRWFYCTETGCRSQRRSNRGNQRGWTRQVLRLYSTSGTRASWRKSWPAVHPYTIHPFCHVRAERRPKWYMFIILLYLLCAEIDRLAKTRLRECLSSFCEQHNCTQFWFLPFSGSPVQDQVCHWGLLPPSRVYHRSQENCKGSHTQQLLELGT